MITLGIESTAHTFGIGIIKDKNVLANVKDSFTTESGGMIPSELTRHHEEINEKVIDDALKVAKIKITDIDLISYSNAPGFGGCLSVGQDVALKFSKKLNIPMVGVHHSVAHLEIGRMLFPKCKDPVLMYASGANTQIIAYEGKKYRVFGETLDQGIGNMIDSFARYIGLGFPGGPKIYELSLKHKEKFEKLNKPVELIELPYVVKGMDVSFGGLSTNLKQKFDSKKDSFSKEALAFSLQETAFAMLVEVSERAMAHCNKSELLLGGGVACNIRLKEMCKIMAKERGAESYDLPIEVNIDNGLMIAWLGVLMHKAGGETKVEDADIKPYLRTDDVDVYW